MSAAFIAFAHSHGVEIDASKLDDSGKIRRCGTAEHPRSTNGAYRFDGVVGWVWAWDSEGRAIAWNDPDARPQTEAEKARAAVKRQVYRDERDHLHRTAAHRAAVMLTLAKPGEHGYLQLKGLKAVQGLVLPEGELFIPMRDVNSNKLLGAQIVQWLPEERRWEKKYLYGMRSKGAVMRLGPRQAAETILAEGYATSLSIAQCLAATRLNIAVVCCFSAHNLTHVAGKLSGRCCVFADNDASGTGESAAKATGLAYVMSDEIGEDANDLHCRRGTHAIIEKLHQLRLNIRAMTEAV